jgi:hypothetical protein
MEATGIWNTLEQMRQSVNGCAGVPIITNTAADTQP